MSVLARDRAKVGRDHPQLRVIVGDLQNGATLADAMRGQDAVISALGRGYSFKSEHLIERTVPGIIAAMKRRRSARPCWCRIEDSRTVTGPGWHARAWLLLVAALGVHVVDEALTGFVGFYNPLILQLRERFGFWPIPTFTLGVFLSGMIALIAVLALLTPAVRRRATGTRALCWVFGVIMIGNGIAHLAGSAYFQRWLPGATSAPLLLIAAIALLNATGARTDHADTP